jgi:predicted homoserine dehydrogenase-like protein
LTNMLDRRSFIIASGLTALASTRALGANNAIRVGVIGAGGRMRGLLDAADKAGSYQIVAVSDVYAPRCRQGAFKRAGDDARGLSRGARKRH